MNPVVYIFLNKELQMSTGKACAQASHAVAMSLIKTSVKQKDNWLKSPHRTIIILEARNEEHIKNIKQYLLEREIKTSAIIDEGVNEIDPHVYTALATEVLNKDDEFVSLALSSFKLYSDIIRFNVEITR